MNKKVKKKMEALKTRIQKLQQQIAGAKQQSDEPGEVTRLEAELASAKEELETLKKA